MTGPTSALAPWQIAELREFADGKPHRPARRPDNLIRRGMLMSVGGYGETAYMITTFGRAVLAAEPHLVPEEAIYPRDDAHRFRIYARRGEEIEVLACAGSPEALGVAIVQLDEDESERGRRLVDLGAIGVLDAVQGHWLIMPWHRRDLGVTVGPSPEELLARLYAAGWRIADDGDPYRPDEDEGR